MTEENLRVVVGGTLQAILAEHVWEHLTYEQGRQAASICFDFLQPGGYVRCAVPDGYFPDEDYQNGVKIGMGRGRWICLSFKAV